MRYFKTTGLALTAAVVLLCASVFSFIPSASAANTSVTISDNVFTPADIGINTGDTVTWSNFGSTVHTVTSDSGAFDSGNINPGGNSFSFTFNTPGVFPYFSQIQGGPNGSGMSGIVTVSASNASTTTSTTNSLLAPTNVTATGQNSSSVMLNWTDANNASSSSSTTAGFNVIRNGSQVATTTGTSFLDTGLTPSTTYSYNVSAFDSSNNTSPWSPTVFGTTLSGNSTTTTSTNVSLVAPTDLMATGVSPNQINLSWTAPTSSTSSSTITGYTIFRNGSQVGTATGTTFSDTGLAASTAYNYTVTAGDSLGNVSPQSTPATGTTLANTTGGGTSTSTPPVTGTLGWAAIPLSIFNQMSGNASSTTGSTSPFTYINGYPTLNGNYVDCNGNIDNDPAHHVTDPNDHDPAHHVGMSCPNGGMPLVFSQGVGSSGNGTNNLAPQSFITNLLNGSGGTPWVVIPLTQDTLQRLLNVANGVQNSILVGM